MTANKTDALAKAKAILAQLKQGGNFEALAEKESACPSAKSAKGSLGKFKPGMMVPEFGKSAFSLKKEEMSDVVKTQFGYHIIKVTEKTPAGYEALNKVKGDIRNYLTAKKTEKILKAQIAKTRKKLNIKISNSQSEQSSKKEKTGIRPFFLWHKKAQVLAPEDFKPKVRTIGPRLLLEDAANKTGLTAILNRPTIKYKWKRSSNEAFDDLLTISSS